MFFYAEIDTDIATRNTERKDTQYDNIQKLKRISNTDATKTRDELRWSLRESSSCFL